MEFGRKTDHIILFWSQFKSLKSVVKFKFWVLKKKEEGRQQRFEVPYYVQVTVIFPLLLLKN